LQTADQAVKRDLIEGRLVVAARPVPWLEMSVGPFVRAYVTDSVTERWVFWQARARVEAPIVTTSLTSYVELWRALSSDVNLVAGAGRVQEAEAGVVYRPPQRHVLAASFLSLDDAPVRARGSENAGSDQPGHHGGRKLGRTHRGVGAGSRRPASTFRHQPIQQLAFPDHAELLARRALLSGGIGFERVRQALQRVELALEPHARPALLGELAA